MAKKLATGGIEIEMDKTYIFPSGLIRRALCKEEITPSYMRVYLENINGKRAGDRYWENLSWVELNASPYNHQ